MISNTKIDKDAVTVFDVTLSANFLQVSNIIKHQQTRKSSKCATNSTEKSSWEANSRSAIQDILLHSLQNCKVYYHVHNSPPLAPIQSQVECSQHPHTCFPQA
jgi:hypothetical protein